MAAGSSSRSDRELETIVKGVANHRRIQTLRMLNAGAALPLGEVAERLRIDFRTASEHLRRMQLAGLILKRNRGRQVLHAVTPRGRNILTFLGKLE